MKKFKRTLCAALAGIMVLSQCACGEKESSGNSANNAAAKQYVYSAEVIDLGVDMSQVSMYSMSYIDGKIYAVVEDYRNVLGGEASEDAGGVEPRTEVAVDSDISVLPAEPIEDYVYYGPSYYLVSANLDGTDQKMVKLEKDESLMQENGYMSGIHMQKDASVVAFYEQYYEDLTDPVNPVYMNKFYAMKWDNQGKLLWTTDMTDEEGTYIYAQKVIGDEAGNITIITGANQIINMDAQGKETGRVSMEDTGITNMGEVITKADGTMYITSYDDAWTKRFISTFDLATGKAGEKIELPGSFTNYNMFAGTTTDLMLTNSTGIYTYNIGDAEPIKIMDFINSDLATYGIYNICFIDENSFVGSYHDTVEYKQNISKFTYVEPATIPDKVAVVLGCEYLNGNIKKRIIDFNKTNQKYRITIKDYSVYNTMEDYTLATTQINNDIISGNMPDIMIVNNSQNVSSWANKGLLVDIGKLIEEDEELSQVEFLQNVWDAFSINEKLYTLVPSFTIQTMVARKDVVGDRTSWTMSEFMDFMKTQGEEVKPFGNDVLRDSILNYIMTFCGSDFVDVNTGKCNFDSPEFVAMLEYANTFPKEFSEDYWNNYDWSSYESMYREKRAVLMQAYIGRIQDLTYSLHGTLGAEATFVGFPGISGNSSTIDTGSDMFAISAKSKCKDGAWEFIRYYLTDEYQNSEELYSLPVSKTAFEAQAKKAMEKPYWIDEDGNKVEYDQTFWMNNEEIILEPFSQAEVDAICEFIYSVNKRSYYNQDIINIVNEEAESFFAGQKSAQEVAGLIQNRVQLYVDENR